jgi:4-diphosphocytidyl-2-C-methyl-D-erythritol kinase
MLRLSTRAPAKVNLVLRVGTARADGYHEIESLMVPLDLADDVEVSVFPGRPGEVRCRCPGHPELDGPSNLAARAAEEFRGRFGIADRCHVRVVKRIPVTAGLGGGSSDAAAVLRCLARAYRIRDRRALAAAALALGSDVPFFLAGGAAWARGRGERLRPARVPHLDILLAYPRDPRLAIRAGDAYRWLDDSRSGSAVRRFTARVRPFRADDVRNDLQAPCFARFSELGRLRALLEEHGAAVSIMSGSGPTVFGLFRDRRAARAGKRTLTERRHGVGAVDLFLTRAIRHLPRVSSWKSPRSASSRSTRRSSRPT